MACRPAQRDLCRSTADAHPVRAVHRPPGRRDAGRLDRGDSNARDLDAQAAPAARLLARVSTALPGDRAGPHRGRHPLAGRVRRAGERPRGADQALRKPHASGRAAMAGARRRPRCIPRDVADPALAALHRRHPADLGDHRPAKLRGFGAGESTPRRCRVHRARIARVASRPVARRAAALAVPTTDLQSPFGADAVSAHRRVLGGPGARRHPGRRDLRGRTPAGCTAAADPRVAPPRPRPGRPMAVRARAGP